MSSGGSRLKGASVPSVRGSGRGAKRGRAQAPSDRDNLEAENEEILSDASDVEGRPDAGYESDADDPDKLETPEAKRLRLAQAYLEEIQREGKDEKPLKGHVIFSKEKGNSKPSMGFIGLEFTRSYWRRR